MTVTKAPAPGTDPAFDKAWEAIKSEGGSNLPPDARDIAWDRWLRYGTGKSDPAPAPVPDEKHIDTAPRALVVPQPTGEPYWWDDPVQASTIDHYILSRRTLGHTFEGGLLIVGPAGCLSGDTIIHINRAGKGDKMRLDRLVACENGTAHYRGSRRWNAAIKTRIARADGPVIKLADLAAAWPSGEKMTFTLLTTAGRSVRATAEHPFLTPDGWLPLGQLRPGMRVQVNAGRGTRGHVKPKPTYRYRYTLYHPHQVRASASDTNEWKVPEHRLVLEAEMNDLNLDTYLAMLRTDPIRSARLRFIEPDHHVHHMDGNPRNNELNNLVELSEYAHHSLHAKNGHGNHVLWQVGTDVIESITPYGIEPTYDLAVADDPHNFIANGFVVHNSGKTQSVAHAVDRINAAQGTAIRLTKMDCPTVTDPQKWFGRREVDATGTHYHKSDFIEAVERGDVILLDEVTRLHPHLHNPVMTLLDGSNSVALSDLNVTISRHPQTVFLATANIGAQYGGTHRMDWAMRERFPNAIERGFPPREDEILVITSRTGCDEDGAARLVDIALRTRQMFEAGNLRAPISTRTLIAAAWWVASGLNEQQALDLTAIPLYDPDANGVAGQESERQQVRRIVEGKFSR